MTCICQLCKNTSQKIGCILGFACQKKFQVRETTLTDLFLLNFLNYKQKNIIICPSKEAYTGADIDWWFVDNQINKGVCLRVQAKILNYQDNNPQLWSYKHLDYPSKYPGQQINTLISRAREAQAAGEMIYPYYLFYNPRQKPILNIHSLAIIDGFVLREYINSILHSTKRPLSSAVKRYSALKNMMRPLSDLFCENGNTSIGPQKIWGSINNIYESYSPKERGVRRYKKFYRGDSSDKKYYFYRVPERLKYFLRTKDDKYLERNRHTVIFISEM